MLNPSVFSSLVTNRLLIRPFDISDTASLYARRNDPEVSKYQNWERPFSMEAAERIVSSLLAMDGPEVDEWWMATIVERNSGRVVGDLSTHLSWGGRSAEVGYNLDRQFWGNGYAGEATESLVRYLFVDIGVSRVFGMLHPENVASAQVLERCGLVFEGHTRLSYWDADGPSDDWIYGATKDDWLAWENRQRHPPAEVTLVPVTIDNEPSVSKLATHRSQRAFVATVLESFGDALFPEVYDGAPVVPILRAVQADGVIVGFVMLADTTQHHPEPYLWRFLIDRMHQRRGVGKRALDAVVAERQSMGDTTLVTSWEEGRGSPAPFYLAYGFVPTGRIVDGETEARLIFP